MPLQKTVYIVSPTDLTPATATTAISPASSAYSSRSWPSLVRASSMIAVFSRRIARHLSPLRAARKRRNGEQDGRSCSPQLALSALRGRRQRAGDLSEDRVHVGASQADCADAHERDQRDQQRVLEQVLPFVAPNPDQHLHHPPSHCFSLRVYDVVVSAVAILPKMMLTFVPASPIAPTQTRAINATSSAY